MSNSISEWHGEHVRFARLLDFLEQQMTMFHAGEHPNYELMRDVLHYLHHYADRYHHPREDVAFARLLTRDRKLQLEIERLQQEHRVIAAASDALLKHLEDILGDTVIGRATVEAAAAAYIERYRRHLAAEENEVLPRAAQLLTPEDWAAVENAVSAAPDPLFGDDVGARYRELREQIGLEART